jgi:hypothetical protein
VLLGEEAGNLKNVVAVGRIDGAWHRHGYHPVTYVGHVEVKSANGIIVASLVAGDGQAQKLENVFSQRYCRPDAKQYSRNVKNIAHSTGNENSSAVDDFPVAQWCVQTQGGYAGNEIDRTAHIDYDSSTRMPRDKHHSCDLKERGGCGFSLRRGNIFANKYTCT